METAQLLPKMPTTSSIWAAYNLNRYFVGVALLLSVVILWTASNFITAGLETGDDAWNKPFLITYFNTASFTVYLLPTLWRRRKGARHHALGQGCVRPGDTDHSTLSPGGYLPIPSGSDDVHPSHAAYPSHSSYLSHHSRPPHPSQLDELGHPSHREDLERTERMDGVTIHHLPRLTVRETAKIAAWWSIVWFVANWAVNASLAWTSVASVTILSSTSGFFTLALGRICRVESLTSTKLIAVIASFLGVLLVTHSDSLSSSTSSSSTLTSLSSASSHPIFGDALALTSAAFYAVYVILLKVRVVDEERADMQLMLGFAGLFNTIFLIPIFPILHYTGLERFSLPPTTSAWFICLTNFCITLSSDYLYVLAMLKTTPTLVTVGLSLTIPLAMLGQFFGLGLGSGGEGGMQGLTLWSVAGAGMVCVGFAMLGWQEYLKNKQGDEGVVVEPESDGEDEYETRDGRREGEERERPLSR
ncbi:hypothetical protein I312_101646 [Cryptococcus bacillisporus CA1280]|uniref:Solute carrier family 35, member F5 n=1 Tax=Cryptococcus bacillisporus CA1280 TaxID=1296109 RepID=A0A0D0VKP1_CRYGA|nr:solute carrier family 35, member F5 [Cryptococcus bacillisporus CA1280]